MLKRLTIRNYALIKELEMFPSENLNVITGETGAGKSIMLGAIGLLLGNRADTRVLWDEQAKCTIEGEFEIGNYRLKKLFESNDLDYDDTTILRREISPGGKSRAFINDTPVTLEVMKQVGLKLIDIHSQHETLELGRHAFQLSLVDAFADNEKALDAYKTVWSDYVTAVNDYEALKAQAEQLGQEADFIQFQLEELVKADLQEDEQESIESEQKITENAEEIKSALQQVLQVISNGDFSTLNTLTEARNSLRHLSGFSKAYAQLTERLDALHIELRDIANELEHQEESVDYDPARATYLRERIDLIYHLLTKHRKQSITELIALKEDLAHKAKLNANMDEVLDLADKKVNALRENLTQLGRDLTGRRKKAVKPLTQKLSALLGELGMPNATLEIDLRQKDPGPSGADEIEILFSANKGIAPKPLSQVASGGEFSRLMFSIKYVMAEKMALPTLILDEIDTGISGEIAIRMGNLMKAIAERHQLLAISHLPQIAARAHTHFFVYKDNTSKKTVSAIRHLSQEERIAEIAKMIGGERPSTIAIENARELLLS